MRLMYQHEKPGPGLVVVKAPRDLPVFITIDGDFVHRSVEIVLRGKQDIVAWAGPSGPGNRTLSIEVGTPSAVSFLKDFFGFRAGASIPKSSVVASGPNSIVSGGDITGNSIGQNAVVTSRNTRLDMEIGVHLFLPFGCEFDVKSNNEVAVTVGEQMMNLDVARHQNHLEMP